MNTPTVLHLPSVRERRQKAGHTSMFLRMLVRAAVLRRGRAASALLAMAVAAAVATTMVNLYVDVQAKLRREFRNYGANIIVAAREGSTLPTSALSTVETALHGTGIAVPFAYVIARTSNGQSVVVAGTDLERARQLNKWWSVSQWPADEHSALVGVRAGNAVSPQHQPFDLSFQGRTVHLNEAGSLQTGAAEDSRVYLPLRGFVVWTGISPSVIEVAATGSPEQINQTIQSLSSSLASAEVRPVRQIMEGEARVLGKTRATLYASAALIILTAGLCVLSTLLGWVFDRRRDFAIMKALGASERLVSGFFAAEAAALGAVGAIFGFVVGIGAAMWIGRVNFHAPVVPRLSVFPSILLGSMGIALVAAILPMGLLRRVQPAAVLRGE